MITILTASTTVIMTLVGFFFGAYWMFMIMYKTEKVLKKKLEQAKKNLEQYTNQYEDNGYEAY